MSGVCRKGGTFIMDGQRRWSIYRNGRPQAGSFGFFAVM